MNLEQALAQYLVGGNGGEGTSSELARFIRWCGKQREIGSLTGAEVQEYAQFAAGSSADASQRLEPVRGFLTFVYREGYLPHNLGSQVRASRTKRQRQEAPKAEEAPGYALTPEGLLQAQERLALLREERLQTTDEIRKAAADKDVRENAPLEAARERLGHLDSRIRDLELLLRSSKASSQTRTKSATEDIVVLGKRVHLRNVASGAHQTYLLVAPAEANPMGGKLSIASPVGRALVDHRAGEQVQVPTPRGTEAFLILEVH